MHNAPETLLRSKQGGHFLNFKFGNEDFYDLEFWTANSLRAKITDDGHLQVQDSIQDNSSISSISQL